MYLALNSHERAYNMTIVATIAIYIMQFSHFINRIYLLSPNNPDRP